MAYHPDSNYHTAHFKPFRVLFTCFLMWDTLSRPKVSCTPQNVLKMQHESKPLSHFVAPSNFPAIAFNYLYINLFDATFAFRPIHITFCPPYSFQDIL